MFEVVLRSGRFVCLLYDPDGLADCLSAVVGVRYSDGSLSLLFSVICCYVESYCPICIAVNVCNPTGVSCVRGYASILGGICDFVLNGVGASVRRCTLQ